MKTALVLGILIGVSQAWAQKLDLSSLDKLDARAKDRTNINMNGDTLGLAGSVLQDGKGGESAKKLLKEMQVMQVRSFEFDKKGSYDLKDLEPIRKQLTGNPGWSKFLDVKEDDETTEMWFFRSENAGGMVIMAAEATELTVVNIVGPKDLSSLNKLATLAGANIHTGFPAPEEKKKPAPAKRDEEEENEN
ncbi:MAG: DUF4252 domain-containing protein [Bryobacteraceae bacterium]|nr:DUF4252 domain-containing protein [Bryobacteraceae bacterium]